VASSVTIARENADKPEVVRSETAIALSYLPPPEPGELALARARATKADPKEAAEAAAFGKKPPPRLTPNWAKVNEQQKEALRVSQA